MNKNLKKRKKTKIYKRITSGLTALVMLFGTLPIGDIVNIDDLNIDFNISSLFASAEDLTNADDPDFPHDQNNEIIVKNSRFAEYSRNCQIYAEYHKNDKITISSVDDVSIVDAVNFAGLGTKDSPFNGSINFDGNTDITLNLDGSLFNYVYDTVTIENNENSLKLSRYHYRESTGSETTPILAQNVLPGEGEKAEWNIDIVKPTTSKDDYLQKFGGLIGRMKENAELTVNAKMNADADDNGAIELSGDADIGLICGYMEAGSSLTASFFTDRNGGKGISNISTSSGNAGGLVGTMENGAVLNYSGGQYQMDGADISTADGYAGGIVGKNDGGTINLPDEVYTIAQHIEGTSGTGGIYGYYKPAKSLNFNISNYSFSEQCQVNGSGNVGGLFGELENNYDMIIDGGDNAELTVVHNSGSAENVGGIIGLYRTDNLAKSLSVQNITVVPSRGTSTNFGGGIALIDDLFASAYVKFDNFTVYNATGTNGMAFGGLVAIADNSFIEANDTTISVDGNFRGGAAVGSLANGVLKLSGTFDISNATPNGSPSNAYREGKIVGYRDNALIYADNWVYTSNNAEVDNIGSWGDIIIFDDTKLIKSDVLTENNDDHTITLKELLSSITISNVADYAKTALAFQIDSSSNSILTNNDIAITNTNITFSTEGNPVTIDLTDTGLRGITRDNAETDNPSTDNKCLFSGTVTGNNSTIILDIQNIGSFPVYRHKYNGIFAFANDTVVNELKIGTSEYTGKIDLNACVKMYAGSLSSRVTGTFDTTNIEINTSITVAGNSEIYVGGLLGWCDNSIRNVAISGSTFNCNITDNNTHRDNNGNKYSCFGGVIGRINHSKNDEITWNFSDVTIKGNITSTVGNPNRTGGLIASVDQHTGVTNRSLILTDVNVNGLTLSGTGTSMGGLLGYSWLNVNTTFHNVTVTDSSITNITNNVNLAGLVYLGTGHWFVEKGDSTNPGIKINSLIVDAANANSFGMIVNKGKNNNDTAIFLEIKEGAYVIQGSDLNDLKPGCVFDEIIAYSANGDINENGQGVVSINVGGSSGGLTMDGSTDSNTYKAQTGRGNTPNSNTRYYYNLDTIRSKTNPTDSEKLMLWALTQYAHSSINTYFNSDAGWNCKDESNSTWKNAIPDGTYDMNCYSWYPVDVNDTVTVNGTFTFYNKEFEGSEAEKTSSNKFTSLGATNKDYTQHHLMQNGLFRDVKNGTLIVGDVTLKGTIGTDYYGSAALVWGTVKGDSASSISTVKMAENGKITLDGIYVHDLIDYNPLLINKISSYSTVSIGNVSNTAAYKNIDGIYKENNLYPKAATSLIGQVGKSDATNINIGFDKIKLDGRKTEQAGNYDLNDVYNTDCSLFTRATLLESFQYDSGSSGIYNYTYDEDWGTDNPRNVTYGSEISDNTTRNQYFGEEFWYYNQNHDSGKYTKYNNVAPESGNGKNESGEFLAPHDFSGFLPYVYIVSTAANVSAEKNYQLAVNHAMSGLTGCGTYNDPYLVPSGEVLSNIAKLLDGDTTIGINLPNLSENNDTINGSNLQSKTWDDYGCTAYKYDTNRTSFRPVDGEGNFTNTYGYTSTEVRKYVAGAYFKLTDNIELDSKYIGLGNTQNKEGIFRGIIIGDSYTITNKSSNPLIHTSYGSVVKNLRVAVENDITLEQTAKTDFSETGCKSYGAVIGQILGGDNIIDNVSVGFVESKISLSGSYAHLVPVGGYVGVVVYGSLIFRNMPRDADKAADIAGIPQNSEIVQSGTETDLIRDNNTKWLYVNPIVGRVINAAVFTESDAYRPFENGTREYIGENGTTDTLTWPEGAVTMKNGMKNYSIADLKKPTAEDGSDRLFVDKYNADCKSFGATKTDTVKTNVTVPNAQALFILSLLVQGKMTTTWYHNTVAKPNYEASFYSNQAGVGGYGNTEKINNQNVDIYKTTHMAEYSDVGTKNDESSTPDYSLAKNDTYTLGDKDNPDALVPYFVENYTKKIDDESYTYGRYSVFCITNGGTVCDMTFGNENDNKIWYMPDGFKGLGCIYKINDNGNINDVTFSVNNLIGNNHTISLNMSFMHYSVNNENYLPASIAQGSGLGLFNTLRQNRTGRGNFNRENDKLKDLILTGSVNYKVYNTDGTSISYVKDTANQVQYLSVGAFAGHFDLDAGNDSYSDCKLNMENIKLKNIDVNGVYHTGGYFGLIRGRDTSVSSAYNTAYVDNCTADNLNVTSGIIAGGFVGVVYNYSLTFDGSDEEGNNGKYEMNHVFTYFKGGLLDANGTGGIVGYIYNNNNNYKIEIRNVDIGTYSKNNSVLIGMDHEVTDTDDLSYFNQGTWTDINAGGVIGLFRAKFLKIENCNVYNADIYGHSVGGAIGSARDNTKCIEIYKTNIRSANNNIMFCYVNKPENRALGGLIGYCRIVSADANSGLFINDCMVEGYTLKMKSNQDQSNIRVGGICGRLYNNSASITSFANLEVKDCKLCGYQDVGGLVGYINDSTSHLTGYNIYTQNIQFSDFDGTGTPQRYGHIVGYDNNTPIKIAGFSRQGTIYREQMVGSRKDTDESRYGGTSGYVIFADYEGKCLTDSKSLEFSDVNADSNVTDYKDSTVKDNAPYVTSSPKTLIGTDQFLTGDGVSAVSFALTPFNKIVNDRSNGSAGAYNISPELSYDKVNAIKNQFTRAREEFDESTGVEQDFPLLIINDTDPNNTTNIINNYLKTLTNTNYNFAEFANPNNDHTIANVALNTYVFNKKAGKFEIRTGNANLYPAVIGNNQHCFRMNANSVDNGHENAQFTMLDVQFKDPSDTSKVAYHLYVPIIVKKLLEFRFNASIESGTSYYPSAYSKKKTLFENLGNPATIKFEYTYERNEEDWVKVINEGENLLGNLYKGLRVTYSDCNWPAKTRLVLVDANNKDKVYYFDNPISDENLELSSFKDESGKSYKPVTLNDLMNVTVEKDDTNGTLMQVDTAENATVRDSKGTYYKYISEGEVPDTKYKATSVTDIQPERYYLSIFTKKNETDINIYHIEISSLDKFSEYGKQVGWQPNKVISTYNNPVHLITGKLYETDFKLTATSASGEQVMKNNNSHLVVTMESIISLTKNAIDKKIPSNMLSAGSSTIYQTFLMTYDTIKTKGETSVIGLNENAYPYTNVLSYKIYNGKTINGDVNLYKDLTNYMPEISGTNYIDLGNKENLISLLRESANEYSATIKTEFWIGYEPDSLGYQFPKKNTGESDIEIGAKVIGYSNISSSLSSINYSESTWRAEGDKRYYTEDDNSAILTYNADTTPGNIAGLYNSLGINSVELGDAVSHIDSTAVYDISELKSSGEYVEFKISLSSRKSNYEDKLAIADYVQNMEIKGIAEEPLLKLENGNLTLKDNNDIKVTKNDAGTEYTLRVKKNMLPTLGDDKIFTAVLSYDVYTGNSKFNTNGFAYSNYMITLNVSLYENMNSQNICPSSDSSDYIIYTNARVQSNVMN